LSLPPSIDRSSGLEAFSESTRRWFSESFDSPTPVQAGGWAAIARGEHALLIAPTGSGKTLAAFLSCIDRLGQREEPGPPGVRVLYVSPLKALVHDIERNLRAPLVGVDRQAALAASAFLAPRVAVRTGDTSQSDRRAQTRNPAEILVTTPESLYLILGSQQRETLRTVETIIVDEIHALAPTKRGAHLALSLERVSALCGEREPQRIGLSATARPLDEVARFLGGGRPVTQIDTSRAPDLDLTIAVPVPDMTRPGEYRPESSVPSVGGKPKDPDSTLPAGSVLGQLMQKTGGEDPDTSLWPAIYPRLLEAIRAHRSVILFVNSRGLCERLAKRLNDLAREPGSGFEQAGDESVPELVRAHHGSIAHEQRRDMEEELKSGRLRAIVATSSLELGIDMGAVDLVLMVESPGSVASGLQRVGRAGHQVGVPSRGIVFPKHRSDLLEATVVAEGMRQGSVEPLQVPHNPLDVLSQQIVAMASMDPWTVPDLLAAVKRTANFENLTRELLDNVLDMLAGRYPSTEFGELRPRLIWDRERDALEPRRGSSKIALLSGGTIPDRGLYGVHLGPEGPRIGELDEEMVHETRPGEVVTLGASSWRVTEITRDRVIVTAAPGEVGRLPFWRGEGPGRPIELGRSLGRFVRELAERCRGGGKDLHAHRAEGEAWLVDEYDLDPFAARNLADYLIEQHEATGCLPTDRAITIERFRDELGDWRVCILSSFGARLHAPWALALEAQLSSEKGYEVQALWSDDGIVLRFADADEVPGTDTFLPDPEDIEDRVVEQLERSALFAGQFRENASRALLLPRMRPGARTPLWTQRLRAQNLLAVARGYPAFPIMLETYRACLQDVFDLDQLRELLGAIRRRDIRVDDVESRQASPFARSLVFAYTATYLYQGDTPVAERRAQALTLDRHMLRELLGHEELRELLDVSVIEELEAELQGRAPEYQARHADAVHDLVRRVGDLSDAELAERCEEPPGSWLEELEGTRRGIRVKIAADERWIAAEDAALYRDAIGTALPPGIPHAFLEPVENATAQLLIRYARTHGPFTTTDVADRFAIVPAQAEALLAGLEARNQLLSGEFHPAGAGREWCDEDVLRRLRRRTLARLRGEVAPVEAPSLVRFLPGWHGIGAESRGSTRLTEVLDQLEGVPLPFSDLERAILPARIPDFDPRMLDEQGALGRLVWIGTGSLGAQDGRVSLHRRDRIGLLADPPTIPEELSPLGRSLLDYLEIRGASFFTELVGAHAEVQQQELLAALWDCVWAGLVTNDTFAPLRGLGARSSPGRRRTREMPSAAAGRWSLVSSLLSADAAPTERAHARAVALLERYGVVSRESMALESVRGGWSAVYPVLRAMEDAGKVRRGHFVEGYTGAQFAFAGAVDRLRAARFSEEIPRTLLLAATDPVQPFGALLPWPEPTAPNARPRRSAGASVVIANGELLAWLDRSARKLFSFGTQETTEAEAQQRVASALRGLFRDRARGVIRLDEIDAVPAARSPWREALIAAGFRAGFKGLELDRSEPLSR
jgi:ATP-dependent Lhr-like helicase